MVTLVLNATYVVSGERNQVAYSDLLSLDVKAPSSTLSYGNNALQFVNVWRPDATSDHRRINLIFIHGGCWLNAYDMSHSNGLATEMAKRGFTFYSVEYRRTGDSPGGWPVSHADVISGVNASLDDIERRNPDSKTYLSGHSAGGHLALLAGASLSDGLNGIIGLAAITDIALYARGENSCQQATKTFMQGMPDEKPESYREASPRLREYTVPVFLMAGGADNIVPIAQSNWPGMTTHLVDSAGHFDWLHPQTKAFDSFLRVLQTQP